MAYLFEVMDNFELGGLVGYTHYFGDGTYSYNDIDDIVLESQLDPEDTLDRDSDSYRILSDRRDREIMELKFQLQGLN